jgi:hypothetical protein
MASSSAFALILYRAFFEGILRITAVYRTIYSPGNSDFGLFACLNVGHQLGLLAKKIATQSYLMGA